jgi:hypothetical protein
MAIIVAVRSTAKTVIACLNTGVVGSRLTLGMRVSVVLVCK